MNDVADLFVGAKFQIVGKKAPVKANMVRAAFAPGVAIPLTSVDFAAEADKALGVIMGGGGAADIKFAKLDPHVFATGWRAYFDVVPHEKFFINVFNETMFYMKKQNLDNWSPSWAMLAAVPGANLGTGTADYKYKTSFEIEPVFETTLSPNVGFTACLPFRFEYSPATVLAFDNPLTQGAYNSGALPLKQEASQLLKVTPAVHFFFYKTPLPLEFKIQYGLPLYIRNGMAMNSIVLQIRAYFMI
jgi:hypothetical protein